MCRSACNQPKIVSMGSKLMDAGGRAFPHMRSAGIAAPGQSTDRCAAMSTVAFLLTATSMNVARAQKLARKTRQAASHRAGCRSRTPASAAGGCGCGARADNDPATCGYELALDIATSVGVSVL